MNLAGRRSTPSSQGSAKKVQAPLPVPGGGGKREAPVRSYFPASCGRSTERGFQARRRPGNLCGHTTCPQHSALASCSVWTSSAHQVFSTILLHTPRLLLCYENKTMHAKGKSWGAGQVSGEPECGTHESPSSPYPKGGPLAAHAGALARVIRTMTS